MKAGYGLKFNRMQMNIKPDFAEAGLTDSFEDFQAEMKKMYDSMTEEGLSEEELLAIAGGLETEEKLVIGIGTGVGVVVTGAAFAAAV